MNKKSWNWRGTSVVRCRGLTGRLKLNCNSCSRDSTPSSGLYWHQVHTWYTYKHTGKTQSIISIFFQSFNFTFLETVFCYITTLSWWSPNVWLFSLRLPSCWDNRHTPQYPAPVSFFYSEYFIQQLLTLKQHLNLPFPGEEKHCLQGQLSRRHWEPPPG